MTTTDMPPAPTPTPSGRRTLRRSRRDRVVSGVAGGLGEYFGLDPVLFRVLFATAAFFGGAGIFAYLIAWAAVPEEGTTNAQIDGWIAALRRRHVPPWVVAIIGGLVLWGVAFSWWAPGPFVPVIAVVVVLVIVFGRRDWQAGAERTDEGDGGAPAPGAPGTRPAAAPGTDLMLAPTTRLDRVDLTKGPSLDDSTTRPLPGAPVGGADPAAPGAPSWVGDARAWVAESRESMRLRRRRALPVKLATLLTLAATLVVLAIIDTVTGGLPLVTYFWVTLCTVGLGLIAGLALRRTPWSITSLLVLAACGTIAFAGSAVSFGDGMGQRDWRPTSLSITDYRLAFGSATLDLSRLPAQDTPRHLTVEVAAGRLVVDVPRNANVTVIAHVHGGLVKETGTFENHSGVLFTRTSDAPSTSTGAPVTVDAYMADGLVRINRS